MASQGVKGKCGLRSCSNRSLFGLDKLVKGARLDEVEQVTQLVSSQSWCGAGAFKGGLRVRKAASWQKTAKPREVWATENPTTTKLRANMSRRGLSCGQAREPTQTSDPPPASLKSILQKMASSAFPHPASLLSLTTCSCPGGNGQTWLRVKLLLTILGLVRKPYFCLVLAESPPVKRARGGHSPRPLAAWKTPRDPSGPCC